MAKRKKIEKAIKSLQNQIDEHRDKIEDYGGRDYTLRDYWEKEIRGLRIEIEKKQEKLKEELGEYGSNGKVESTK